MFTSECSILSLILSPSSSTLLGVQWLSGRVLDSRLKGRGFEPHRRHCVVSLSKNIIPSLVLVQPRKTHPYITKILLMGCKESNQIIHIGHLVFILSISSLLKMLSAYHACCIFSNALQTLSYKLEFSLKLKIKLNDWLLADMCLFDLILYVPSTIFQL